MSQAALGWPCQEINCFTKCKGSSYNSTVPQKIRGMPPEICWISRQLDWTLQFQANHNLNILCFPIFMKFGICFPIPIPTAQVSLATFCLVQPDERCRMPPCKESTNYDPLLILSQPVVRVDQNTWGSSPILVVVAGLEVKWWCGVASSYGDRMDHGEENGDKRRNVSESSSCPQRGP